MQLPGASHPPANEHDVMHQKLHGRRALPDTHHHASREEYVHPELLLSLLLLTETACVYTHLLLGQIERTIKQRRVREHIRIHEVEQHKQLMPVHDNTWRQRRKGM